MIAPVIAKTAKYKQHPLAKDVPAMKPDEFERLCDSVHTDGLWTGEEIDLYEGMVLDGWHRYLACLKNGVVPRFREYVGGSPAAYVIRRARDRRHLAIVQLIRLADQMRPALEAEAKTRQTQKLQKSSGFPVGLNLGQREDNSDTESGKNGRTDQAIADATGASRATVAHYHAVQEKGSEELKAAVANEEVSISDAANVARQLPPEEQTEAVEQVRKGKARTASAAGGVERKKKANAAPVEREPGDDTAEIEADKAVENAHAKTLAEITVDAEGAAIPEHVKEAFLAAKGLAAFCRKIDELLHEAERIVKGPAGRCLSLETITHQMKNAKGNVWANRPTHVCPYCHGKKPKNGKPCEGCKGDGWVPKHIWSAATNKGTRTP